LTSKQKKLKQAFKMEDTKMNIQNPTVGLMYFSPTGTTKRVCKEIAQSISTTSPIRIDLTKPQTPELQGAYKVDLWIVGVPVYASRMPW
jgi:flavodoxin